MRIPAKIVKEMALKDGDRVEMALTLLASGDELSLEQKRARAIEQLKQLRGNLTSEDLNYRREELYRF